MVLRLIPALVLALGLSLPSCVDHSSTAERTASGPKNPPPPSSGGDDDILRPDRPDPDKPGGGDKVDSAPAPDAPIGTGDKADPKGVGGDGPGEPVPEPGTMLLVGTGLAGAALYHRRRRRRNDGTEEDRADA